MVCHFLLQGIFPTQGRENRLAIVTSMSQPKGVWLVNKQIYFKGDRYKTINSWKGNFLMSSDCKRNGKGIQGKRDIKLKIKSEDWFGCLRRRLNIPNKLLFAKTFHRQNGGHFFFLLSSEQGGDEGRQSAGNTWYNSNGDKQQTRLN